MLHPPSPKASEDKPEGAHPSGLPRRRCGVGICRQYGGLWLRLANKPYKPYKPYKPRASWCGEQRCLVSALGADYCGCCRPRLYRLLGESRGVRPAPSGAAASSRHYLAAAPCRLSVIRVPLAAADGEVGHVRQVGLVGQNGLGAARDAV